MAVALCRLGYALENVLHNSLKLLIHFFKTPGKSLRVLAHLQCGNGNTAGIGCLTGHVKEVILQEYIHSLLIGRHICSLCYTEATVLD